ncbi:damage-control phosphatase ARMT1 family protein [Roseburia sp. 499]|uniref:damage-control phosphatase ARMT1 family protein n=1 Tax=Roseburia sp. 499 TaxID=1261634 RepID=UPI0009531991|nr:ARMT1-like domain-containing protein [Roseburia sp. 499]WVK71441.1 ARMT1-like domain-containing protein [Roseburia sp. 499]
MKMKDKCLPCLVNQVIKVADITKAKNREQILHEVFAYLSKVDFNKTNPEISGETFRILKKHLKNKDPYLEVRNYYNNLLMKLSKIYEEKIIASEDSFYQAMKYAVIGNIIDFNPIHNSTMEEIMDFINQADGLGFQINDMNQLKQEIKNAQSILYLGDNCGEICFDKIFIKEIKKYNPDVNVYFGVRGEPVINDSIETDAYAVGMDEYASIVSNGDGSLGTVLERTSEAFQSIFEQADVIIAKGQANYECLSECEKVGIYFLLMTKCEVIADDIGVPVKSLICMKNKEKK